MQNKIKLIPLIFIVLLIMPLTLLADMLFYYSSAILPSILSQTHIASNVDIAHKFGIATQSINDGYAYYSPPDKAIDGNDSTFNHTRGTDTQNWWQVELPNTTKISKIMVLGRNSNTWRLSGAGVYISDTPYDGTLDESDKVATLLGNAQKQIIEFSRPETGTYLIIKARNSYTLHMATVEVYGQIPTKPIFENHNDEYLISGATANGEVVASLKASDYQDDALSYTIIEDVPFSIDAGGNIRVTGPLSGQYSFTVQVTDGVHINRVQITLFYELACIFISH